MHRAARKKFALTKPEDRRTWPAPTEPEPAVKRRPSSAGSRKKASIVNVEIPNNPRPEQPSPGCKRRRNSTPNIKTLKDASPRRDRRLSPEEELLLVDAAQEAMRRHPGNAVVKLKQNPNKRASGPVTRDGPSIVTHHILVGSGDHAGDISLLKQYGITHILNVSNKVPNYFPEKLVYHNVELTDATDCDVRGQSQAAFDFLSRVESLNGRVLVHCVAGVSRAVTVVLMYLIAVHRLRLRHAWEYMASARPFMSPNEGFRLQLAKLELDVFGESRCR